MSIEPDNFKFSILEKKKFGISILKTWSNLLFFYPCGVSGELNPTEYAVVVVVVVVE